MELLSTLKFYLARLRHPHLEDYLDEGFGIAARAKRAKRQWRGHLENSKGFQVRAIDDLRSSKAHLPKNDQNSLAVLGSGRLLDVPEQFLIQTFNDISLFDADPEAIRYCNGIRRRAKRQKCTVHTHLIELSSAIINWTEKLTNRLASQRDVSAGIIESIFKELESEKGDHIRLLGFDCVVSLNLLSQVPLYWKERVLKILRKFAPKLVNDDDSLVEPLQGSLISTMKALQMRHLLQLSQSSSQLIVVITDDEFYFYTNDRAEWLVEPALFVPFPITLSGYNKRSEDAWLWHIAPQGIENKEYGSIHRVRAMSFVKN